MAAPLGSGQREPWVVLGNVSAFFALFALPCTISLGPMVLVRLAFFQANRCVGSEACKVLDLWTF